MNKEEFKIKSGVYSIMRLFAEFKVVTGNSLVYCVGGCVFDKNEVTVKQDFFKNRVINPFINNNGNFAVKSYEWHKEECCIELNRSDSNIKIYCLKPQTEWYFDVAHAVFNEKSFCNEFIADDDSCEINGVHYNVTNPARIRRSCVAPEIINDMCKLFNADEYPNTALKLFYVKDFEKRIYYIGLWDAEKHCPVSTDLYAPTNVDYSDEYKIFFPV